MLVPYCAMVLELEWKAGPSGNKYAVLPSGGRVTPALSNDTLFDEMAECYTSDPSGHDLCVVYTHANSDRARSTAFRAADELRKLTGYGQ